MSEHSTHSDHAHQHGDNCGHRAVRHAGHVDYLHDGHLHNGHGGHIDEHTADTGIAADACTSGHTCNAHDATHRHGATCGHERIPHGTHDDYIVGGHVHRAHDGHCDDHGRVSFS